jgi:hypothetical protein
MRRAFFKVVGFDLGYSLPWMNQYFFKVPCNQRATQMKVKCRVRRDHLYEDGRRLLLLAGPGMLRIDLFFEGEEGIGFGPTQEFFEKFARELCRCSQGLWRNESRDRSSEYVFSKKGLFPSPNAPAELVWLLGLLCGKVLLMDMLLAIDINPAFFKLVLGMPISVAEVDEEMAASLSTDAAEGLVGLPFTYPGIPEMELIEGGAHAEVTKDNVGRYIEEVTRKTVEMPALVAKFREAISTVVPWEFLQLFTPEELTKMIGGERVLIKREDMEFVKIGHGYTKGSPQIAMLFDVLEEMSPAEQVLLIRFITGSSMLPFGGLRALDPRLTVALRVPEGSLPDESLPSVMTCANYLKIPAYTTKQVMREQFLKAITYGQDTFLLT